MLEKFVCKCGGSTWIISNGEIECTKCLQSYKLAVCTYDNEVFNQQWANDFNNKNRE